MVGDKSRKRKKIMRHALKGTHHSGIIVVDKECKDYINHLDFTIDDKSDIVGYEGPQASTIFKKKQAKRMRIAMPNMSLDNMLSASHALSICQNGRKLDLDVYPVPVKNYVSRVVRSGKVDERLKQLNKLIVLKIRDESEQ